MIFFLLWLIVFRILNPGTKKIVPILLLLVKATLFLAVVFVAITMLPVRLIAFVGGLSTTVIALFLAALMEAAGSGRKM